MITLPQQKEMQELGAAQRRAMILEFLKRNQIVQVTELSQIFGISLVSARRDLEILEKKGQLKRIHGGAVAVQAASVADMLKVESHERKLAKERIGKAAAELIRKSDNIIFDSGTTPLEVAKNISYELLEHGNLSVITSSIPILNALGKENGVHFILLGGIYLPNYDLVMGPQTVEQVRKLHADKLFLGSDGLTFTQGITTANQLEAEVSRTFVESSSEVIVVSDSSKIGSMGLATIAPLEAMNKLVTDKDAPADFVSQLRERGVEVILV